jgi:secondary thiamine-phosphate synthase enzyme
MSRARIGRSETLAAGAAARQALGRLMVETAGPGFTEITAEVARWLEGTGIRDGLLTAFCRHTSASLTIQENADPDVQTDLLTALDRLAPRGAGYVHDTEGSCAKSKPVPYLHRSEGADDMPAHIRTMLTDVSLSIPVIGGPLALGTWQGVYLIEHRDQPHRREIVLHLVGD